MPRFAATVRRQGEDFTREDGVTRFKASITNSTKATFSLANRASFYEGLCQKGVAVGEYVKRDFDGMDYLVETTQIQPRDNSLSYVFLARCNDIVTLARPVGVDAGSDRVTEWDLYAENVKIFKTTTTRSMKEQNDGLLDQAIYLCHLPARYGIQKLDRVYLVTKDKPLSECEFYRVDSIDDSLSPLDETIDLTGIDVVQLTLDDRTGKPVDPDAPDPDPGGGDDGWWD